MKLSEKQQLFARNFARLIEYIYSKGFLCSIGEVQRTKEQAQIYVDQGKGILDSLHCKKLAADIFLFNKEGVYLEGKDDYRPFGEYWETLEERNRWGGCFKRVDSVHFEMQDL